MQSLRLFKNVRTFRELFERITWDMLKKMAMLPFVLFMFSPVICIIHNFWEFRYLWMVSSSINTFSIVYIIFVYFLCAVKLKYEHLSLLSFVKKEPVFWFFGCFVLLIIISTIVNISEKYALGCTWRREYFFTYILYVCGYFGCAAFINKASMRAVVIHMLQAVSLLQVVLVFLDRSFVTIDAFHRVQFENDITSSFPNRNHYGYYLTIIILVSAALFVIEKDPKWRVFDGICYLANTYTLMRVNTLGCFIAVFVGLIFLFIMLRIVYGRFKLTVLMLIGAFIALFLLSSLADDSLLKSLMGLSGEATKIINNDEDAGAAGSGRWNLWKHTVQYIGERPVFGWGSEGIFDRLEEEAGNSRPHNEYLQYAVFFGIPAALCYIAGVVSVFIRGLKKRAELDIYTVAAFAAGFGYLFSAFFGNTLGFTSPYFFTMLGFAVRPCRRDTEKRED